MCPILKLLFLILHAHTLGLVHRPYFRKKCLIWALRYVLWLLYYIYFHRFLPHLRPSSGSWVLGVDIPAPSMAWDSFYGMIVSLSTENDKYVDWQPVVRWCIILISCASCNCTVTQLRNIESRHFSFRASYLKPNVCRWSRSRAFAPQQSIRMLPSSVLDHSRISRADGYLRIWLYSSEY